MSFFYRRPLKAATSLVSILESKHGTLCTKQLTLLPQSTSHEFQAKAFLQND